MLGDTLTTTIGSNTAPVVTNRNSGESDNDFIHRHCRAVLAQLQINSGNKLANAELPVNLTRANGQSDESFVAAFCTALQEAAQ